MRRADPDPEGVEPLFCGKSIFTRLAESTFGRFSRALTNVDLPPTSEAFSLPRVVVIGCEKSGKSTLLEALTKCSIFPRAEGNSAASPISTMRMTPVFAGIATRMPVRLQQKWRISGLLTKVSRPGQATPQSCSESSHVQWRLLVTASSTESA